jgi:isopentenyl diphosphate isomerase/L-lactate dehydrogenase-like FMN-dependent dehydrogenase
VAIEIYKESPELFGKIEVLAKGGARFGTDILKLLALGVCAVGLGRPLYFANQYSADGVTRAADLLKYKVRKVGEVEHKDVL